MENLRHKEGSLCTACTSDSRRSLYRKLRRQSSNILRNIEQNTSQLYACSESFRGTKTLTEFYVLLTAHPCIICCKQNQLCALIFFVCLLLFSTCFGQLCAHHQEKIPYLCDTWYLSLYIDDWYAGQNAPRYFLLMMGTQLPQTCIEKQ